MGNKFKKFSKNTVSRNTTHVGSIPVEEALAVEPVALLPLVAGRVEETGQKQVPLRNELLAAPALLLPRHRILRPDNKRNYNKAPVP